MSSLLLLDFPEESLPSRAATSVSTKTQLRRPHLLQMPRRSTPPPATASLGSDDLSISFCRRVRRSLRRIPFLSTSPVKWPIATACFPLSHPTPPSGSQVLVSLLPAPSWKPCYLPLKTNDYTRIIASDEKFHENGRDDHYQYNNSSYGQWFVKFGEVISTNTL